MKYKVKYTFLEEQPLDRCKNKVMPRQISSIRARIKPVCECVIIY